MTASTRWGWDPEREALGALTDIAPSTAGPRSVRAAVWLAFEAIPFFPSAVRGDSLVTRGFTPDGKWFTWPLWEEPLSARSASSLLALPDLVGREPGPEKVWPLGLSAVYRTQRLTDANGRGIFRAAAGCFG